MKQTLALLLTSVTLGGFGCSSANDAKPGTLTVQISGEEAASDGFLFPTGSEVTFQDGWELHFSHLLVTVADVTLSDNPDKAPADQSQTDGVVARQAGPWAADLALPGTVSAAEGEGAAVLLTRIDRQNLHGGDAFATDRRYAFGYRIALADSRAEHVNFAGDDEAETLYARMVEQGISVMYAGTATFKGTGCDSSDESFDFDELPRSVPFELGFATPTHYVNCQNQDNQGDPFDGENYQRGIAMLANAPALAQITLHLEHPFFSDTVHDSSLYFDQLAARLPSAAGEPRPLELSDLVGVDPTAFSDLQGAPLPWRSCPNGDTTRALPAGKERGFGVGHTLVDPQGDPRGSFRDYRDFIDYVQSTQGHLNGGEGLCYVARDYPSPE